MAPQKICLSPFLPSFFPQLTYLTSFTVIAACVTGFALTDMIVHNRSKRAAFYAEQHSLYATRVMEAIEAEKAGQTLDDDQKLVMNRERARVRAEELKKERSWGKRAKGWLFGGLKKGDEEEGKTEMVVPSEGEVLSLIGVRESDVLERTRREGEEKGEERRDGHGILEAVEEQRREGERLLEERGLRGGPLDRVAEEAVEKVKGSGGWMSWGKGG